MHELLLPLSLTGLPSVARYALASEFAVIHDPTLDWLIIVGLVTLVGLAIFLRSKLG
jgi:hypothetical protein